MTPESATSGEKMAKRILPGRMNGPCLLIGDSQILPDPFACAEIGCEHLDGDTLDYCETKRHCCFAWQRRREEDAIEREKKDAKAKEVSHGDHR